MHKGWWYFAVRQLLVESRALYWMCVQTMGSIRGSISEIDHALGPCSCHLHRQVLSLIKLILFHVSAGIEGRKSVGITKRGDAEVRTTNLSRFRHERHLHDCWLSTSTKILLVDYSPPRTWCVLLCLSSTTTWTFIYRKSHACNVVSEWDYDSELLEPTHWFAILHLTGKLFTPLLFAVSKGWHWMLSVMTAIGVFVCRPIDMLAPCHTVWWITVCVIWDDTQESATQQAWWAAFNDDPIANIMAQMIE